MSRESLVAWCSRKLLYLDAEADRMPRVDRFLGALEVAAVLVFAAFRSLFGRW